MNATRPELSYDGRGINGPDEYRTRIATFANDAAGDQYGKLFQAAPELLEACYKAKCLLGGTIAESDQDAVEDALREAIRKATA